MQKGAKIRQLLCPREKWINDKTVSKCMGCDKLFVPLLVWRHHCRFCGKVFCNECDSNIMTGDSIGYYDQKRLRHCNPCKMKIDLLLNEIPGQKRDTLGVYKIASQRIQIDDPDQQSVISQDRRTNESLRSLINQQKIATEQLAISLLRTLTADLCQHFGLEIPTWEVRLAELAWRAANESKPEIFIRKQPFNLSQQIRTVMIVAPPETVTAVLVKGLVLERNIPSKNLEQHIKYPRIVTIRPAIEAGSLTQTKNMKFDELVNNVDNILKSCLDQVFKLNPNIMFVQEEVNQIALELALQRKIMVISKIKNHELEKIQRLAWIRRRIDNLFHIDRSQIAQIIGCCERVYFKTVKQGQMLMFIEHQAGIRTVLLGDTSDAANSKLKKIFQLLLRAAWNLKNQREMLIRDTKICPSGSNQAQQLAFRNIKQEKYLNREAFVLSQEILISKMRYCFKKSEFLPKNYQQYCKLKGRRGMYDPCGGAISKNIQIYSGKQISLGSFLLQFTLQNIIGCEQCQGTHIYRYFVDDFCITIQSQSINTGKSIIFADQIEQDEELKKYLQGDHYMENNKLFQAISKYMAIHGVQEYQSKVEFLMYFKCDDCGAPISQTKSKVGNDYLLISFNHFFQMITHAAQKKQHDVSEKSMKTQSQSSCEHSNIVRVFQFPRSMIKIAVHRIEKYSILPIMLNEAMMKRLDQKDSSMISDLFNQLYEEKVNCIESLQTDMARLPFAGGANGVALGLSISGASALNHAYFEPFIKIQNQIIAVKEALKEIETNLGKYKEEGVKDWTVLMRKFAKIDHVIKIAAQMIFYMTNMLRKQKIEEKMQGIQQMNQYMSSPSFEDLASIRKRSEVLSQPDIALKNPSLLKTNSVMSYIRIRKDTSALMQTDFDQYLKTLKKRRYLKYQGAYLYYPIGSLDDAVSLLSCFLNTEEFKQALKEPNYRQEIIMKLQFLKDMKNDWKPYLQAKQIYKELTKQDYNSTESQQIEFSVYYHKQFEELRVSEGIGFHLYVRSLYGCQSWDSSGGKSNSSFSKAHNETLVVKIINEKEFVEFQKFAKAYLKYMKQKRKNGEQSYLAKIYGIYEVHIKRQVYKCVVMQNVFFGLDNINKVYDLKGSEVNRLAPAKGTGLDTNFIIDRDGYPYLLDPEVYEKTMTALEEDANFLKEQGVIDYSLMVVESSQGLRMAIIDFMRPYQFLQKIENLYKQIKSGKDPTVIPPNHYAQRFIKSMRRYFAQSGKS